MTGPNAAFASSTFRDLPAWVLVRLHKLLACQALLTTCGKTLSRDVGLPNRDDQPAPCLCQDFPSSTRECELKMLFQAFLISKRLGGEDMSKRISQLLTDDDLGQQSTATS